MADLAAAYLRRFFPCDAGAPVIRLDAMSMATLVWPLVLELKDSAPLFVGVRASDAEADAALAAFAETGDIAALRNGPAGGVAAIFARLAMAAADIVALAQFGEDITLSLPRDTPDTVRRNAVLLHLLGTVRETTPPEWRGLVARLSGTRPASRTRQ